MKEINKTVQDLRMETETIKNKQTEETLEMEKNNNKRCEHGHQNTEEERLSGADHTIEEIDTAVKENVKSKDFPNPNIQEIWDT